MFLNFANVLATFRQSAQDVYKFCQLLATRYPITYSKLTAASLNGPLPKQQTEYREWANVDAASGDGRKDAADEAGQHEDDGVPGAKVDDAVVRLALLLPKVVVEKLAKQIEWPLMVSLQMFGKTFWYFLI